MAGGFEAAPEELRGSARSIATALEDAGGTTWQRPSGDYGHAGVQSAFTAFVEDAERRVGELGATADGLGRGLGESARAYEESDATGVRTLMKAVENLGVPPATGVRVGGPYAMSPEETRDVAEDPGFSLRDIPPADAIPDPPPGGEPSELFKRLNPNWEEGR
jgi:hypothetical protein